MTRDPHCLDLVPFCGICVTSSDGRAMLSSGNGAIYISPLGRDSDKVSEMRAYLSGLGFCKALRRKVQPIPFLVDRVDYRRSSGLMGTHAYMIG